MIELWISFIFGLGATHGRPLGLLPALHGGISPAALGRPDSVQGLNLGWPHTK